MITIKEILALILALIVLAFSNSFSLHPSLQLFLNSLLLFAVILIVYTASKKLMAYYLDCREETKVWSFQRYGWRESSHFQNPVPIGIILPFLLSLLSLGMVKWFAVTESDFRGTPARAVRKHDYYSFTELTEWHIGLISAAGILAMFVLAAIVYFLDYSQLARLAIYFAAFNMIPLGKLDGTRIFFGSKIMYAVLLVLTFIGLTYALLMP